MPDAPTGRNNRANPYYAKIHHTRLAKCDYTKTEFFGTIGGQFLIDDYSGDVTVGENPGQVIFGYRENDWGTLVPATWDGNTIERLECLNTGSLGTRLVFTGGRLGVIEYLTVTFPSLAITEVLQWSDVAGAYRGNGSAVHPALAAELGNTLAVTITAN